MISQKIRFVFGHKDTTRRFDLALQSLPITSREHRKEPNKSHSPNPAAGFVWLSQTMQPHALGSCCAVAALKLKIRLKTLNIRELCRTKLQSRLSDSNQTTKYAQGVTSYISLTRYTQANVASPAERKYRFAVSTPPPSALIVDCVLIVVPWKTPPQGLNSQVVTSNPNVPWGSSASKKK